LKSDGNLIIIDRFHNNSTPETEIRRLLSIEYSEEFKLKNFIPLNKKLTRQMNGEHEYRYQEIIEFMKKTNFLLREVKVLCSDPDMQTNDVDLPETIVNFRMGGFFQRKAIFIFSPVK